MTTIEREELLQYKLINRFTNKSPIRHKYDKGLLRNFSEVYESNPLLWFIPINPKHNNAYAKLSHL